MRGRRRKRGTKMRKKEVKDGMGGKATEKRRLVPGLQIKAVSSSSRPILRAPAAARQPSQTLGSSRRTA